MIEAQGHVVTKNSTDNWTDILIIGAGPAGIAAAVAAAQANNALRITLLDDNPLPGGQIWRGELRKPRSPQAQAWFARLHAAQQAGRITALHGARVFAQPVEHTLLAEQGEQTLRLRYDKLILATGARERFLPFPGWTLPGVVGAGGLQALVKTGLHLDQRRVVVAGSGPLLLAVAAYLREQNAQVVLLAEQASLWRVARFGLTVARHADKLQQAVWLQRLLRGVRQRYGCWPIAAHGTTTLEAVTLQHGARQITIPCNYLACGFGLMPNSELAMLLGCTLNNGFVAVNEWQQTSRTAVFCAGEAASIDIAQRQALGIGGVEAALIEGEIAGYAASGQPERAAARFAARQHAHAFAAALETAFALRSELKALPQADTLVCRCEDVRYDALQTHADWRAAKLHTRCGMGACQGRICGGATEFLFGWQNTHVRPPLFPVSIGQLAHYETNN